MSELLSAAGDLGPWYIAILIAFLACVYALEKLGGKDGPITRFFTWLSDRELNTLRRQGEIEREKQHLRAVAESGELRGLRAELDGTKRQLAAVQTALAQVSADMGWLRRQNQDHARRDRHNAVYQRDMAMWLAENLPRLRTLDPTIPDPPAFSPLPDLLVLEQDIADLEAEEDWSGYDQPDQRGGGQPDGAGR